LTKFFTGELSGEQVKEFLKVLSMRFSFTNKTVPDLQEARAHLNKVCLPLVNYADLDPLLELIGEARYVLLGEASHGTHEYYTWRTHISKRLIAEKGFNFIAVEGDWPDCYRLNRYIKGYDEGGTEAKTVLEAFNRWPTWMWANWEVVALAEWMRKHNKDLPANRRVGFYGLDVYSLWESMDAVIKYLEKNDPLALKSAQQVLKCFEPFDRNEGTAYAHATYVSPFSCEEEVVHLLAEIRRKLPQYNSDYEAVFSTEQNALVAVNAERYYRSMIKGGAASWNVRDYHMMETLNRLMDWHGKKSKVIVWEHNTHIGDARATDMRREGMVNVGQLAKQEHSAEGVIRVGFGSNQGTVIAGREWGAQMKRLQVPPAVEGSWENILHNAGMKNQLFLSHHLAGNDFFKSDFGHRAIGVVYNPEFEKYGNYVPSKMTERYEAFIYLDKTSALHPLHITPDGHQMPETYPFGV
jgi:erythromycin esterase